MSLIETFLWGFGGSLAVEIVTIYQAFTASPIVIPDRYKFCAYWLTRFCVALVGVGLAVAYGIDKPILAANIGAATPGLMLALTRAQSPYKAE